MRELSAAKLLTEGVHPMEEQSMTKAEKRCEWLTDKYILCLLALFPLFTGFHGYANLTAAKFLALHRRDGRRGCSGCCRASAPAHAFLQKSRARFSI